MITVEFLQGYFHQLSPFTIASIALAIPVVLLLASDSNMLAYLNTWMASSSYSGKDKAKHSSSKKHAPRTRAHQAALNSGEASDSSSLTDTGYFPGLVNTSGTYCFLNSTLQAMASLTYIQPQLDNIHDKAELWDVPTPTTDALRELIQDLNTPISQPRALRPAQIINALSAPNPYGTRSRLFSSREHQDAQELFQLLSSMVQEEAMAVDKESRRDTGLAAFDRVLSPEAIQKREASKNVFEGLTANRRSCVECGYTEAVMHFPFDNLTLPVPNTSSCALEDCLKAYTYIELLEDCICQKCSMVATLRKLTAEADRLSVPSRRRSSASEHPPPDLGGPASMSMARKKRAREARKLQVKVQEALDNGLIENEIKGVKLEKVKSSASTKQVMIARPPPVLALHLNRSSYFGHGFASKNPCRVVFPEILDLTPYTTSGALSTAPSAPISSHGPLSTMRQPLNEPRPTPVLYRLSAVVCHYGGHSFGHYVAFRRKPTYKVEGGRRTVTPPRLVDPVDCMCDKCAVFTPVREESENDVTRPRNPNGGWFRISDDSVEEVGIERVLRESGGTFMLYYERVLVDSVPDIRRSVPVPSGDALGSQAGLSVSVQPLAGGYGRDGPSSPRSSEETITPENVMLSSPKSPRTFSWSALDQQPTSFDLPDIPVRQPRPKEKEVVSLSTSDPSLTPPLRNLSRSSSTASARIVRSVYRPRPPREQSPSSAAGVSMNPRNTLTDSPTPMTQSLGSANTKYIPLPSTNGHAKPDNTPKLASSVPSPPASPTASSSKRKTNTSLKSPRRDRPPPPHQMAYTSPQSPHAVVGLKA